MTSPKAATKDTYGNRIYPIPHPMSGEVVELWSVTRLIDLLAKPALVTWKMKMVATGLSRRPDLVALAGADPYNAANQAIDAARDAANLGTAVHSFTELADAGTLPPVEQLPDAVRPHMNHYADAMVRHGWRVIAAEQTVHNHELGYAGTFDRVLELPDLGVVVADIKTGKSVYPEIALQLAALANAEGIWDPDTGFSAMPEGLRTDLGVCIHLTPKACKVIPVDLTEAIGAWRAICAIRRFQRTKPIGKALTGITPAPDKPRYPIDDRRDWVKGRVRRIVEHSKEGADLLATLWPTENGRRCPTLREEPLPSPALIDLIVEACDKVDLAIDLPFCESDPRDRDAPPGLTAPIAEVITRLQALPSDLQALVAAEAAEAGVPNLRRNPKPAQVSFVAERTTAAEAIWEERKAQVASIVSEWDDEMWRCAVDLLCAKDQPPESWTLTDVEDLAALSAAIDVGVVALTYADDGSCRFAATDDATDRLVVAYGSKSGLVGAGKEAAKARGRKAPRSAADISGDVIVAARLAAEGLAPTAA